MSDPEDAQNEANDELDNDNNEINDYDDQVVTDANPDVIVSSSTTPVSSVVESSPTSLVDEYDDDEPLEDYVVKLVVNGEPDSSTSSVKDIVDAGITDSIGDDSKTSAVIDAINGYTSTIVDELAGNGTAITGGEKRWLGFSTRNWIIIGLIALCIIGIILALLFCLLAKRGKNKRTQKSGTTTTTKEVVTKGISTDQRYQQVPNV